MPNPIIDPPRPCAMCHEPLFRVIVADPPWPFRDRLPGNGRGAAKHYSLMKMCDIRQHFDRKEAMPNALLLLWRVSSMQAEAIDVCRAWGFEPYGEMVWRKLTPTGRQHFGMGRLLRQAHESVLIGVRGKPLRQSASVRSIFDAPVGRHSQKPDEFYELVEELSAGPYLELFARRRRKGWTCRGDEL